VHKVPALYFSRLNPDDRIPIINRCQLTPINRLLSYHATGFCGGYAFYATGTVKPCRYFDSVHAMLCTKLHVRSNLIYRHLPDRIRTDADAFSILPSPLEGQDRRSFSSNPCTENYRGGHQQMLLPKLRFCKRPDIFSQDLCSRVNPKSDGQASATVF
jgi:hypothetical protein